MARFPSFRAAKTQPSVGERFRSVHANDPDHFNSERHLVDRQTYKALRLAPLAEWRQLAS